MIILTDPPALNREAKTFRPRDSAKWAQLLEPQSLVQCGARDQLNGAFWAPDIMPVAEAEALVSLASQPGDTVLDPFGGIGTTGAIAHKLGREFVGFEIDPERYKAGLRHLPSTSLWFNSSIDESDLTQVRPDAMVTSPPFGRRVEGVRTFDGLYFAKMTAVMTTASKLLRRDAVGVVELMNWPEVEGGEELLFYFRNLMLSCGWGFVRELIFIDEDQRRISDVASHRSITVWLKGS